MSEVLTLTTPQTYPSLTDYRVVHFQGNTEIPYIKITVVANTGEHRTFLLVPGEQFTLTEINSALSFINQGKFATLQGKSLQRWLLEQLIAKGLLAGTVSGSPD